MSLVVAGIHQDHITLVSDTKVTFYVGNGVRDERRTRDTYFEALPKIVLLRSDLAIGVTGEDPDRAIEGALQRRDWQIEELLEHLAGVAGAAFVVAALDPPRLWTVGAGTVADRTSVGRSWAGDAAALERFQARFHDVGHNPDDLCFRLRSSMQWLTSFDPVPSVGGTTLVATSGRARFRFAPMFTRVVDFPGYEFFVLPGLDPTAGAVGLLIPETGKGLVFTQERPWEAVVLAATSRQSLADAAFADAGQVLQVAEPPDGFGTT